METLELLFPKPPNQVILPVINPDGIPSITITNLAGESVSLEYKPYTTIDDVKEHVELKMKIITEQQILLYNGIELKVSQSSPKPLCMYQ